MADNEKRPNAIIKLQTKLRENKEAAYEKRIKYLKEKADNNKRKRQEKRKLLQNQKNSIVFVDETNGNPSRDTGILPRTINISKLVKKKRITDKQLVEKRLKEREKKRKQREKLRQDPEAYEKAKQKERERNQKRKNEGKLKSINQMTSREKRLQRKRWKENIARYRAKNTCKQKEDEFLKDNSPPSSSSTQSPAQPMKHSSVKKCAGRRKVRREKTATYRQLLKVEAKLHKEKTRAQKYKQRWLRLIQTSSPSPRKKVSKVMSQGGKAIRKRLLFGEALEAQLVTRSKNLKGHKEKQLFAKCISGPILKKYRVIHQANKFTSYYQNKKNIGSASLKYFRKKKKNALQEEIKKAVCEFLERDDNTCMAPGKKDCITMNNVKKQKRYLMHSLEALHKTFLETSQFKLSYVSFTRIKPFWIVTPKVCERDTCLCIKHANFKNIITKLHKVNILKQGSTQDLCTAVCCCIQNKECMYGECKRCEIKNIPIVNGSVEKDKQIFYYQWINKQDEIDRKLNKIKVKFVIKEKFVCTTDELIRRANNALPNFLKHAYNATHQFERCKQLKELLHSNEVFILIDFSENYNCKYEKEIQSAHFGTAKKQVTLHTGVIYHQTNIGEGEDSKLNCVSFCSVSKSPLHNANAIWAHLKPVLQMIKENFPHVNTFHFQSDGPTSQYRNRTNSFLFRYFCEDLGMEAATWNFTEAGHGKGSADGIGGVIKRTADQAVAYGKDISNIEMFMDVLQSEGLKVRLFNVTDSDIKNVELLLPKKIRPIPNIMKLHQLVWSKENKMVLGLRELTCIICGTALICNHFSANPGIADFSSDCAIENNLDADPSSKEVMLTEVAQKKIDVGQWVAVIYDNNWYPGLVDSVDNDTTLHLSFMGRSGEKFFWPKNHDKQLVQANEILCCINVPPRPISSRYFTIDNAEEINKRYAELNTSMT